MPERESVGFLHDDVPYLKIGHGPAAGIGDRADVGA